MHRGKQGLELELLKLILQSSEKTPVLVMDVILKNISITENV